MWIRACIWTLNILLIGDCARISGGYHGGSGGSGTERTTTPWHVGLYTKTSEPYKQICGGTIIAKHVVATGWQHVQILYVLWVYICGGGNLPPGDPQSNQADTVKLSLHFPAAHCITQDRTIPPASQFAVAAGKLYRPWNDPDDNEAQKSDIKEIKITPRYQGAVTNFQEDIALLILTNEFVYNDTVRPACLYFNAVYDETQLEKNPGKVVGWGLTGENSKPSRELQAATLPSVPIEKCIDDSPVSFRSLITADKICAGYSNGTAVCRGDSGGGLVVFGLLEYDSNCREYHHFLRGVVSTAPTNNNDCNIYTWATFTHLLRHEHFVKSVVPDVEESCIPTIVHHYQKAGQVYKLDGSIQRCEGRPV